jgi:septum formation protein
MTSTAQKIYLASKSPRRRELLRQIGIAFDLLKWREHPTRGADVSEAVHTNEAAHDYVARVTREKAACAQRIMRLRNLPAYPILSADTTVVIDNKILGKPGDIAEATRMLTCLSGRTHQVMTSVVVLDQEKSWQCTQTSSVTFATLTTDMIAGYCATEEPYDKAGSYAIQGLAAVFIREINGSHSGIMGLPLFETAALLQQAGLRIL